MRQAPKKVLKTRKISDILWEAMNTRLWSGKNWGSVAFEDGLSLKNPPKSEFSCCAVAEAELSRWEPYKLGNRNVGKWSDPDWEYTDTIKSSQACKFLRSFGVKTGSCEEFESIDAEDEAILQGARFLWLHFAYLVALDMEKKGELKPIVVKRPKKYRY